MIMKKFFYITASALFLLGACESKTNQKDTSVQELSKEAIAVHDEIMPQIGTFDRTTVKIDSLLGTNIDEQKRQELEQLKSNLESATDNMMTWMKDYTPDSTNIAYQEEELVKIKAMKKQFEDVSLESNNKLAPFK